MTVELTEHPAWRVRSDKRGLKMIHRPTCRYAQKLAPYNWAGERSVEDLIDALLENDGWRWHLGCRVCAWDLDNAIGFVRHLREA